MASNTNIITCSSDGICSDMWNLYSDTHPHLHDNFMDPPKQMMVHPDHNAYRGCNSTLDRGAFNMYYGAQTAFQCRHTTSPMVEVHNPEGPITKIAEVPIKKITDNTSVKTESTSRPRLVTASQSLKKASTRQIMTIEPLPTKKQRSKSVSSSRAARHESIKRQVSWTAHQDDDETQQRFRTKSDGDVKQCKPKESSRARCLSDGHEQKADLCSCKCVCRAGEGQAISKAVQYLPDQHRGGKSDQSESSKQKSNKSKRFLCLLQNIFT